MNKNEDMSAVCSQLLTQDDLHIEDELFVKLEQESIITSMLVGFDFKSLKIFSLNRLFLSSITPVLHSFKFEIIDEVTYHIIKGKKTIYISKFNLNLDDISKIKNSKENIEYVITQALLGKSIRRSHVFALVVNENFSMRKILLINAIIEYINQAVLSINSLSILHTLTLYSSISKLFLDYFICKFDPKQIKREKTLKQISNKIEESIKNVPYILDDKILKLTYSLFKNLLRTNYFLYHETMSFKINVKNFGKNLKGLQANLENFVFHNNFSGLHLRMSKISRGGLRWSNRHDDYREEIKSLMITQEGKNSIIIPDGSKGGFVINESIKVSKQIFEKIYSLYINAMLDLVDNRIDGKIIKNENIISYDGDDSYFVVAADKGTATMSDIANNIAIKRSYWLGDAFASGGTNGFGHKDLGITAKGSLVSTRRFFIEKGIDFYKDEISIVGIGSMNGDVFGNGMIESNKFKLIAAISQKEIFIDPKPNTSNAFEERNRLFVAENSSWSEYNKKLISKGGGVFYRSDKEITLSTEIKKLLKTTKQTLSGEELAKKLLCLNVDMLFSGGVGTYVKASDENSLNIGDKQNEALRINANELKALIVCEGGNLGFTQKARIEYALKGGKINLDGIDNAAGVDTSDREVNLKILLHSIKNKGLISKEEVSKTLHSLTDQIVKLVLKSNYEQVFSISIDERFSRKYLSDFFRAINVLEKNIVSFNRELFFIPKEENFHKIIDIHGSIVRPVLSSLLSYAKIFVKNILLESTLIDETFLLKFLYNYFPKSFVSVYENEIKKHPLKKEIIATKVADFIINSQGATFVSDYERFGHNKFLMKIKAYLIVNELFDAKRIRELIYKNDYIMNVEEQYSLINKLEYTLYASARWMVKYLKKNQLEPSHILEHKDELFTLLKEIHTSEIKILIKNDDKFNLFFSVIDYLRFTIAAINIKENSNYTFKDVIVIFYSLIHEFRILEIIYALRKTKLVSKSDFTLRNQILQFIEFIVVDYTQKILNFQRVKEKAQDAFINYMNNNDFAFNKVRKTLDDFIAKDNKDLKEISITVNQLMVPII